MAIEHNINLIMKGNAEANQRYGGGGEVEVPGLDQMPAEIRAGMAALQKDIAGRVPPLDRLFKSMGIEFSLKSMLKQSQVFTSYVGTIFQLMGALVDVMLAPLLPYLIPVARWIGSKLPGIAEWMKVKVAALAETLTPMFNWIKNTFEGGWEKGWEIVGTKIRGWLEDHNLGWVAGVTDWFTNLFAKEKGWTQVGGAIAAAFGAALVFKLPKLAITLAWKAITKGPGIGFNAATSTTKWLRNAKNTGLAGASTDELLAIEKAGLARTNTNLQNIRSTGNVKSPNWMERTANQLENKMKGMASNPKVATASKITGRVATALAVAEGVITIADEIFPEEVGIPFTKWGIGGAHAEREELGAELGYGKARTDVMSAFRKSEGVSTSLLPFSSMMGGIGAGATLGGSLYFSQVMRGEMEKQMAMDLERQQGVGKEGPVDPLKKTPFFYRMTDWLSDYASRGSTTTGSGAGGKWWEPTFTSYNQERDPRKWMQNVTQVDTSSGTAFDRGNLEVTLNIAQPDGGPPKQEIWEIPLGTGQTWEFMKYFQEQEGTDVEFRVSK